MKPREIKKLTATLKAIADPTRRAIFDLVWNSEKKESISTITKEFKITRQGITKHLKILSQGDLIELKRIGRVTYCNANSDALERAENWIKEYRKGSKEIQALGSPAEVEKIMNTIEEIEHLAEEIIETVSSEESVHVSKISPEPVQTEELEAAKNTVEILLESTAGVAAENSDTEKNDAEEDLAETAKEPEELLAKGQANSESEDTQDEFNEEEEKPELLQMSIDPNDPGTPVKEEPVKEEPVVKEIKEKPIVVTENQLDIYGIRKEPKLDEENQQFELF